MDGSNKKFKQDSESFSAINNLSPNPEYDQFDSIDSQSNEYAGGSPPLDTFESKSPEEVDNSVIDTSDTLVDHATNSVDEQDPKNNSESHPDEEDFSEYSSENFQHKVTTITDIKFLATKHTKNLVKMYNLEENLNNSSWRTVEVCILKNKSETLRSCKKSDRFSRKMAKKCNKIQVLETLEERYLNGIQRKNCEKFEEFFGKTIPPYLEHIRKSKQHRQNLYAKNVVRKAKLQKILAHNFSLYKNTNSKINSTVDILQKFPTLYKTLDAKINQHKMILVDKILHQILSPEDRKILTSFENWFDSTSLSDSSDSETMTKQQEKSQVKPPELTRSILQEKFALVQKILHHKSMSEKLTSAHQISILKRHRDNLTKCDAMMGLIDQNIEMAQKFENLKTESMSLETLNEINMKVVKFTQNYRDSKLEKGKILDLEQNEKMLETFKTFFQFYGAKSINSSFSEEKLDSIFNFLAQKQQEQKFLQESTSSEPSTQEDAIPTFLPPNLSSSEDEMPSPTFVDADSMESSRSEISNHSQTTLNFCTDNSQEMEVDSKAVGESESIIGLHEKLPLPSQSFLEKLDTIPTVESVENDFQTTIEADTNTYELHAGESQLEKTLNFASFDTIPSDSSFDKSTDPALNLNSSTKGIEGSATASLGMVNLNQLITQPPAHKKPPLYVPKSPIETTWDRINNFNKSINNLNKTDENNNSIQIISDTTLNVTPNVPKSPNRINIETTEESQSQPLCNNRINIETTVTQEDETLEPSTHATAHAQVSERTSDLTEITFGHSQNTISSPELMEVVDQQERTQQKERLASKYIDQPCAVETNPDEQENEMSEDEMLLEKFSNHSVTARNPPPKPASPIKINAAPVLVPYEESMSDMSILSRPRSQRMSKKPVEISAIEQNVETSNSNSQKMSQKQVEVSEFDNKLSEVTKVEPFVIAEPSPKIINLKIPEKPKHDEPIIMLQGLLKILAKIKTCLC